MNAIDKGFHVRVAMRELLGVESPIAVVVLPTVVESDPGKSKFLDGRKGLIHLLELHCSPVSPSTPDRAIGAVGRRGHLKSLAHHQPAVFREGAEIVPLMHGNEGAKSMKSLPRFQSSRPSGAHRDASMTRVWHGNRERD